MSSTFHAAALAPAIDLNHPGTYLTWSVFTISVANLVVIAVMVVIFGAALILPFPKGRTYPPAAVADPASGDPLPATPVRHGGAEYYCEDSDRNMCTNLVRRRALALLRQGQSSGDQQGPFSSDGTNDLGGAVPGPVIDNHEVAHTPDQFGIA